MPDSASVKPLKPGDRINVFPTTGTLSIVTRWHELLIANGLTQPNGTLPMTLPTPARTETLDQLKAIIRRDLNLGADEAIADEMPLVGGDLDLDSLDVLMLVTSVEKQFKVKIANQNLGREAFETVATLAAFIEQSTPAPGSDDGASDTAEGAGPADPAEVLAALPHQAPFRFVDELTELDHGNTATGVWRISGDEPWLAGHFPGNPLVPGVLISEALAQVAGLAYASSPGSDTGNGAKTTDGRLAQVNVRFRAPVAPPAAITLHGKLVKVVGNLIVFEISATVSDQVVAEGTLTLFDASGA